MMRDLQLRRFAELKAEIDRGMADVTEGRLTEFDPESIIALGRKLSVERAKSAVRKEQKVVTPRGAAF
jgi:antitoxin ParD1/3/4